MSGPHRAGALSAPDNSHLLGYDAVVLAGGTSQRMGVVDKTRLPVRGVPLLERALLSVTGAERAIVVGEQRPTPHWCAACVDACSAPVLIWERERPAGGGPAAAVAAGVGVAEADVVVLIAGDQPLVERRHVERLLIALGDRSGAVAVDDMGHPQWLLSAWRRAALANAGLQAGGSLRRALQPLDPVAVDLGEPHIWLDCDAPADLARAESYLADKV